MGQLASDREKGRAQVSLRWWEPLAKAPAAEVTRSPLSRLERSVVAVENDDPHYWKREICED